MVRRRPRRAGDRLPIIITRLLRRVPPRDRDLVRDPVRPRTPVLIGATEPQGSPEPIAPENQIPHAARGGFFYGRVRQRKHLSGNGGPGGRFEAVRIHGSIENLRPWDRDTKKRTGDLCVFPSVAVFSR